jgi:hypothetical protein
MTVLPQARGTLPLDAMTVHRPSSIHLSLEVYPRCDLSPFRHSMGLLMARYNTGGLASS